MRVSRVMFWVLTCSLGLSILLMFALGLLAWPRAMERVFAIMWLFNGHLAAAAICASANERNRGRPLAILGMAASTAGFLLWLMFIVLGGEVEALARWGAAIATFFTAMAVYAAFVGALMHLPGASGWVARLRLVIAVVAAGAALHVVVAVAAYPFRQFSQREATAYAEMHWRWIGIYLVVIAYTTLVAIAAIYLRRLRAGDQPMVEPVPINLTCPRCERNQQMKTEGDVCAGCGLRIKVALP